MINKWKKEALDGLPEVFSQKEQSKKESSDKEIKDLQAKIGELTIERIFFSQNTRSEMSRERRKQVVNTQISRLSITQQCELLDICQASFYYKNCGESD